MKTRLIQAILLASILTWVWGSAAWAGDRSRERSQQRIQRQTRSLERGGMNTNQGRIQRTYDRREDRQMQRIRNGVRNGEITRNEYRRHGHYKWGRHATRYHGHLKRHHYWHHHKGHSHPVAYTYHNPYPTQSYYTNGYAFSGSINEPGWTLGFSTGGHW